MDNKERFEQVSQMRKINELVQPMINKMSQPLPEMNETEQAAAEPILGERLSMGVTLEELKDELYVLDSQCTDIREEIEDIKREKEKLSDDKKTALEEVFKANDYKDELEAKLAEYKSDSVTKTPEVNAKISEIENQIAGYQNKIVSYANTVYEIGQRKNDLENKWSDAVAELGQKKEELAVKEAQRKQLMEKYYSSNVLTASDSKMIGECVKLLYDIKKNGIEIESDIAKTSLKHEKLKSFVEGLRNTADKLRQIKETAEEKLISNIKTAPVVEDKDKFADNSEQRPCDLKSYESTIAADPRHNAQADTKEAPDKNDQEHN